jgi:hypothetical protein
MEIRVDEARRIGLALGIKWEKVAFDPEEYRVGIQAELEHAHQDPARITDEDELAAFKTALEELTKSPDHYRRLEQREAELRAYAESL